MTTPNISARSGFSVAFASCFGWHAAQNFSRIIGRDTDFTMMGDWSYNDGQMGSAGQQIAGDYCDQALWYTTLPAGGALTIGAAVTVNGVAGQLPMTNPTIGAAGTNYPNGTYSVRLTRGDGGTGAVAAITVSGGTIQSATMVAAGQGYANVGNANFTFYDQPWDSNYFLRRQDQVMAMPGWAGLDAARKAGQIRVIYMPDDHDHGGNNWDWSTATSPPGASTLPKVLDYYRSSKLGTRSVMAKYASNTWTAETLDIPPSMFGVVGSAGIAAPADIDRIWWYRDRDAAGRLCGGTTWQPAALVGPEAGAGQPIIREIFLDCIRAKAPQATQDVTTVMALTAPPTAATAATLSGAQTNGTYQWTFGDGSVRYVTVTGGTAASWLGAVTSASANVTCSKQMLGPNQVAQIKALALAAKNAGFKSVWINSGKDVFNKDNGDGWWSTATPYFNALNDLLTYLDTNNIPALWMCGDRHCAHSGMGLKANGDAWDVFTLCPTPLGSLMGAPTTANETGNTPYPQMLWQHMDRCQCVYGRWIWDDANQQTVMACYDMSSDRELFAAGIPAYQRTPAATGGWTRASRTN